MCTLKRELDNNSTALGDEHAWVEGWVVWVRQELRVPANTLLNFLPLPDTARASRCDPVHAAVQGAARIGQRGGGHFGRKVGSEAHGS